jgi:tubulin-specific chaperone D
LAGLFKYGPREVISRAIDIVKPCLSLVDSDRFQKNSMLRKFLIKLAQRLALCSLKVRIASWRYQRGPRQLAANLSSEADTTIIAPVDLKEDGDYEEITEETEQIIGILLEHLHDKDTIVRWAAAKGIGRICNRLNFEMGDQVVGSVIATLEEDVILPEGEDAKNVDVSAANDFTWHGACLALAELSRRGLLLPIRLSQAVPWVIRVI